MKKFMEEFKTFALRGNVIDLAVGVIIAGAFGKIVTSLVNDILMPSVGLIMGGTNLTDLKYIVRAAEGKVPELAIRYGAFIQTMVDFTIIAFSVFVAVKLLNAYIIKKKEEPPASPPEPPRQEVLLEEIRDLLKKA